MKASPSGHSKGRAREDCKACYFLTPMLVEKVAADGTSVKGPGKRNADFMLGAPICQKQVKGPPGGYQEVCRLSESDNSVYVQDIVGSKNKATKYCGIHKVDQGVTRSHRALACSVRE